jgi:hypothetical protein
MLKHQEEFFFYCHVLNGRKVNLGRPLEAKGKGFSKAGFTRKAFIGFRGCPMADCTIFTSATDYFAPKP